MANSHRAGGKITGSHTTLIDLAKNIVMFLEKDEDVNKITLGIIVNNPGGRSPKTVKIITETACTLVRVTQAGSIQEFRFYSINTQESKLRLARHVRNNNWQLRFGKNV